MHKNIYFEEESKPQSTRKEMRRSPQTLGSFGRSIELIWPTDYLVTTQGFGQNPELHTNRNMPGHDGLDIRAPANSQIYASAEGVVEAIHIQDTDGHPLGRFITIAHQDGYRTTYGHLSRALVSKGQKVMRGSVIGNAGRTGHTSGGHIHFSLSKQGATANGLTPFAEDIIDPTPFFPYSPIVRQVSSYAWPFGRCLKGVHINAEDDAGATPSRLVSEAALLDMNIEKKIIGNLRKNNPTRFFITQLQLPSPRKPIAPGEWATWVKPAIQRHIDAGVGYFAVLKTPNLTEQGFGLHWSSGKDFGRWWMEAVSLLKADHPTVKFGFPALSPGDHVTGRRYDAKIFMEGADEAMLSADWLGVVCNWASPEKMSDEDYGKYHATMRRYYPDQLFFIVEFGSLSWEIDEEFRQREANHYMELIKNEPGIGAAFFKG